MQQAIGRLPEPTRYMGHELSDEFMMPSDAFDGLAFFGIEFVEGCNLSVISSAKISRLAMEQCYPMLA